MGVICRKCMYKGCINHGGDRTWFNEDYDKNNPFLCKEHYSKFDWLILDENQHLLNEFEVGCGEDHEIVEENE